ncbi:MAG: ABC transporter permease [Phyllobacteriaceae bacterium]|nr:ABC transporter permease [Phyllobacteriaceae bacterium]
MTAEPRISPRLGIAALLAPLPLLLVAAYAVPFLGIATWSVTLPTPGLSRWAMVVSDPLLLSVVLRTLRICLTTTALSVTLAYVLAYVWVRGTARWSFAVELCVLVPFWISVLTRAFGWVALLSNRGLLNTWGHELGLLAEPLTLVRNEFGVVVGMTHFLVSFAVLPLASAMRRVDERVLMAARGLGAGPIRTFWTVWLPMTKAGIVGATLLVLVFSLGFFVTPAILGGGRSVMIAEFVWVRMFQSPDWGLGAAISLALLIVVAALMALFVRFARPRDLVGGR